MGRKIPNQKGMCGVGFDRNVKSKYRNNRYFWIFFRHLYTLAMNRFRYKNLPIYCERYMIESAMCNEGSVLFLDAPGLGVIALPYTSNGKLDIYRVPKVRRGITSTGYNPTRTNANSVVVWNDDNRQPFLYVIVYYAELLTETEICKFVNREQQKRTKAIVTSPEHEDTVRQVIAQQKDGQPYVLATQDFAEITKTGTLDLSSKIILKELDDEKNAIYSEYLTMLGYNNINIDKKAQLTEGEAYSNSEHILAMRNDALTCRREGIEKVNRMFGTNIEVEFSILTAGNSFGGIVNERTEGGVEDGGIYDDIGNDDLPLQPA